MKNLYTFIVILFIGIVSVTGSASAEKIWQNKPTGKIVEDAYKATKEISITSLKQLWDDEDITLLDVRTPREYEALHIPEAESAPRGLLEFIIWSIVPDENETIYVYCRTGGRAALATKLLNELGYKNAIRVEPGIAAWAKAGYPVQTSFTDEELILMPVED